MSTFHLLSCVTDWIQAIACPGPILNEICLIMTSILDHPVCALPARAELVPDMVGDRRPIHQAHRQPRRRLRSFIAFLVVAGEIGLVEDDDTGEERSYELGPGELHVHTPHLWQRAARPFPVGSAFLWWHLECRGTHRSLDREAALALIDRQQTEPVARRWWLVPRHIDLTDHLGEFRELHRQLWDQHRSVGPDDPGTRAVARHLMHRLHRRAVDALVSAGRGGIGSEQRHAHRARRLIAARSETIGGLSELAQHLDLDPAYLARCFKRATGGTVGEALLARRIDRARELLLDPDLGLKEIAAQCGFGSFSYFSRRFKQATGETASAYRRRQTPP